VAWFLLFRSCVFLSGQVDGEQSRKRSAENDDSSAVADTASSSKGRPSGSQYHSSKKRQHLLSTSGLSMTPSTGGSRILTATVSSDTHHSADAAIVRDTESNYVAGAMQSSTRRSADAAIVRDTESNYVAGAMRSSTRRSADAAIVRDTESNYSAGVIQSTESGTHGSKDACSVHVHDTQNSFVTADALSSTPAETVSTVPHAVTAAEHAAVRMQNSTESLDDPVVDLENSVQSSNTISDFR